MKIHSTTTSTFFATALLLAVGTGCTTKWLGSGSESQSSERRLSGAESGTPPGMSKDRMEQDALERGSVQPQDANAGIPDLSVSGRGPSPAGPGGVGLSGLDSVPPGGAPSEERLSHKDLLANVSPSRRTDRQDQDEEVRKVEAAAAAAAGLNDVFFGYDSWMLTEEAQRTLAANATWIKANPMARLKVEGHCDERGTHDYNLVLGEKRAKTVRSYLLELGVNTSQVSIVSYGKDRPFCHEHQESCYQQNRRGHMTLRVLGSVAASSNTER